MNDPYVAELIYRVVHDSRVQYERAKPLEVETLSFKLTVKEGFARFELREHCATEGEARAIIDPVVRSWNLASNLTHDPGEFELVFEKSEVVDRNPMPGVFFLAPGKFTITGYPVDIVVGRVAYPTPNFALGIDAGVEAMHARFVNYRRGKETLPSVAYFCLTVLVETPGKRAGAVKKFNVSDAVLSRLGQLSSGKGGIEARKASGRSDPYTENEKQWVEQALRKLIFRAAESASAPGVQTTQITMADLPAL